MPSETYVFIREAVRGHRRIAFVYHDRPRECCPLILGYSKDGREAVSAYQVAGETSGGKSLPEWRCFRLEEIRDLRTSAGRWLEGGSHRQPQMCVQFVDVDANIPETLTRDEPRAFGDPELQPPRRGP
jgi:hypothetical protein